MTGQARKNLVVKVDRCVDITICTAVIDAGTIAVRTNGISGRDESRQLYYFFEWNMMTRMMNL